MSDAAADSERRARGLAVYRKVYGEQAVVFESGTADFFDLMVDHLFAEVWARPGLPIGSRRLLVMGVLAAQHHFDILGSQFERALEAGELTADEVREIVIHLIPYVGYPCSGELHRVSEAAIAARAGDAA